MYVCVCLRFPPQSIKHIFLRRGTHRQPRLFVPLCLCVPRRAAATTTTSSRRRRMSRGRSWSCGCVGCGGVSVYKWMERWLYIYEHLLRSMMILGERRGECHSLCVLGGLLVCLQVLHVVYALSPSSSYTYGHKHNISYTHLGLDLRFGVVAHWFVFWWAQPAGSCVDVRVDEISSSCALPSCFLPGALS
jgi:hypothetical protein